MNAASRGTSAILRALDIRLAAFRIAGIRLARFETRKCKCLFKWLENISPHDEDSSVYTVEIIRNPNTLGLPHNSSATWSFFPPRILVAVLRKFIQGYRDVSWAYVWNEKGLISIRGRCRTKAATGNCSRAAADNSEMGVCIHCIHLKALPYNEDCVEEAFISWGDTESFCVCLHVILLSAWVFSMQYGPLPQSKHIQVNLRILPLGVSVSVTVVCVFARGLSRVYPWLHPVSAGHRHKKIPWHC